MIEQNATIRRVVLLLKSLDSESRSAILSRLPAGVRCRLEAADQETELRADERQESAGVAHEFFQRLRELQLGRAKSSVEPDGDTASVCRPRPGEFDDVLERAPQNAIRHLINNEHPQTVAVIVAHLAPDHAASLLRLTTAGRRADILQRIMDLEESDPHALDEIRNYLVKMFDRYAQDQQKSQVRMSRVQAILGAADSRLKAEIQRILRQHDHHVTAAVDSPGSWISPHGSDAASTSVRFDRIVDVPDVVVNKVFRNIPVDVAAVALIGASQPARKDLLQRLPADARQAIDAQLTRLGPLRVTDIQLAQQIVLSLIDKLLNQADLPHDVHVTLSA